MNGNADEGRSMVARVSALFVHPLKSAAAIPVDELTLDARGAVGDRRWMLVDADGMAITAREYHRLALIQPAFAESDRNGALILKAAAQEAITVTVPTSGPALDVRIWDDTVSAWDAGDEASEWCSAALGARARMVYLASQARRPLQPRFAGDLPSTEREVAFSDGAPLLLLGQGSIDGLNERLLEQGGDAVSVARFRPNVLLGGIAAHEEDAWREIVIGGVTIGVGSQCLRCVMTTVDPQTAESGVEPLRTFASYRRADGGVVFGMNATHAVPGTLRVGDAVTVTRAR